MPPENAAAGVGSSATFDCQPKDPYGGTFIWKFIGATVGGENVYVFPPFQKYGRFNNERFSRVGTYGLSISSLELMDGGTYDCNFLNGDLNEFADLFVFGKHGQLTL